jgi:hypothetical protein
MRTSQSCIHNSAHGLVPTLLCLPITKTSNRLLYSFDYEPVSESLLSVLTIAYFSHHQSSRLNIAKCRLS